VDVSRCEWMYLGDLYASCVCIGGGHENGCGKRAQAKNRGRGRPERAKSGP